MPAQKIPAGIVGATGIVGQRLVAMLAAHPWFELTWLAASERSIGRCYGEAAHWRLATPLPAAAAALPLSPAQPRGCPARVVFAALDAAIAAELEPAFAAAGHIVVSNSSALRLRADVPLVIPEINADHLALVERQPTFGSGGYVVTNPNCSAIGLALALAPLQREFGLQRVSVVTMQAISGAGYPGVAALDILGNVIPHIAHEEEKIAAETVKILGTLAGTEVRSAAFALSAQCHRVPVEDGHTEAVTVELGRRATLAEVEEAWRGFHGRAQQLRLPTAPAAPVWVSAGNDRPQPRLDGGAGGGMSVVVGRLRPCAVLDYKFNLLVHNSIRGAAGAALLNAELLHAEGRLP